MAKKEQIFKDFKGYIFSFLFQGDNYPLGEPLSFASCSLANCSFAPSVSSGRANGTPSSVALKTPLCCIRKIIAAFFPQNERRSRQFLCQFARMQKVKTRKGKRIGSRKNNPSGTSCQLPLHKGAFFTSHPTSLVLPRGAAVGHCRRA